MKLRGIRVILCAVVIVSYSEILFSENDLSGVEVAVIAPSISTSSEAKRVLTEMKLRETKNYRTAAGILVIVRSALFNPLDYSYDSICDLKDDAEQQLNIAGTNFHIYLYSIEDSLASRQLKHFSYEAE